MPQHQDLTIFSIDDDAVPLAGYGAVDAFRFLYRNGDSVAALGGTFTRATPAWQQDSIGVWRRVEAGVLRDKHFVGGLPTTLIEPQRTNVMLRSDIQGAVGATPTSFTKYILYNETIVSQDLPGLDEGGKVVKHRRISTGGADSNCNGQTFVPTANAVYVVSAYFWVPSSFVGSGVAPRFDVSGGTTTPTVNLDLSKRDQWQRVWAVTTATAVPASIAAFLRIFSNAGVDTDTIYSDCWQAELVTAGVTAPSSWIKTDGAAVTRNVEILSLPIAFNPAVLTFYTDGYDVGAGRQPTGSFAITNMATLGRNTAGDYDLSNRLNANGVDRRAQSRMGNAGGVPSQTVGDVSSGTLAYLDRMEIATRLYADGRIDTQQSINAGAVVTGGMSAAGVPIEATWGANTVEVGGYGSTVGGWAIRSVKVAPGLRSLVEMRSYDGVGITEATFSTDPTHARPYLKYASDIGDSSVDFIKGSSVIGQLTAEIVDARRTETDQDTGIFTYLLATAQGDTQLLGVRVVYRQQREDGTWEVLFDGIGGQVSLTKLTTFKWQLRDARERERKMRAFAGGTQTVIYPHVGPATGWGFKTRHDAATGWAAVGNPVMPPILGMPGRTILRAGNGVTFRFDYYDVKHQSNIRDLLLEYGAPRFPAGDELADHPLPYYKDVIVEWSYDNVNWVQVVEPLAHEGKGTLFRFSVPLFVTYPLDITFRTDTPAERPTNGSRVYVRARSLRPPTAAAPLYWQGNLGQLLKDLYDGVYSPPGSTPVRYDPLQMAEFIRRAPFGQARITEAIGDVRMWVQEHIYRVCRAAPAIRNGVVYPIFYDLPDASVPLTQLDNSNTIRAEWKHGPDRVVNQVVVEYERDIVPTNSAATLQTVRTQKVILERNRLADNSQRRHGTKPVEFRPATLRAVVTDAAAADVQTANELGGLFAEKVMDELLRRFANGAQEVEAECLRTAAVDALREGDWVVLAVSWLPDYVTRERGINRLMQVTRVGRGDAHKRHLTLLDAGPHDQPLAQPTLGAPTANANLSVTIPVTTVVAGTRAEVQFALGAAAPATDSGQWISLPPLEAAGNAVTPSLVPGQTVWTRGRSVADGRRPSAWTTPQSVVLPAYAELVDFRIEVVEAGTDVGKPRVVWDQRAGTAGVRIYYQRHAAGTDAPVPPYASYVDADATIGFAVLPIVLDPYEQVSAYIHAYPGFAAGAVTGAVGAQSVVRTAARRDQPLQAPTVTIIDVSPTQRQITLTVKPPTATIRWRIDAEGSASWNQSTDPNGRVAYPVIPIVDTALGDRVLECQTLLASGEVSPIRRVVLDEDANPEILAVDLQESPANTLVLNVGLDDDVVHYRVWARRGQWPTHDNTATGTPLNENLIYDDNVEISTLKWWASGNGGGDSTWYVIIRAYDEFWNFDQATATKLVSGAPPAIGALSNVRVESAVHGADRFLDILWDHNAEVQSNLHHVRILENGVEVVTLAMARDARVEHDGAAAVANVGGYHRQKPAYDETGEQLTYNYTVELYTGGGVLRGTYACSITSWFATGGGGGSAPTEIPDGLAIDFPNNPAVPRGTWNNTSGAWGITVNWETSGNGLGGWSDGGSSNLAAGSTSHEYPFPGQPWVRFRVRYYNGFGPGPWSAYSAPAESQ